jgi:hypothetical protein
MMHARYTCCLANRCPCALAWHRGLLSAATIRLAEASGAYTPAQLAYLRASSASTDARDVAWHRPITQLVNCRASEREANNRIMHVLDYEKDL